MSFLDEADFDVDRNSRQGSRYGSNAYNNPSRFSNGSRPTTASSTEPDDFNASTGGFGANSSSRARMLAQQREIQLKKRQAAAQSGGMIRSSTDMVSGVNPMRKSTDSQFTPAVRQFSAPKAVRDEIEGDNEFIRPSTRGGLASGANNGSGKPYTNSRAPYGEDENDNRGGRNRRNVNDEDDNYGREKGSFSRPVDRDRYSRNEDAEEESSRGDLRGKDKYERYERREVEQQSRRFVDESRNVGRNEREYDEEDDDMDTQKAYASSIQKSAYGGGGWSAESQARQDTRTSARYVDPDSDNEGGGRARVIEAAAPRPQMPAVNPPLQMRATPLNLSNMRAFLTTPLPKSSGIVQCYIKRNKNGTNKLFPIYSLYLKNGDRFLMASKKRPKNKTSNYLISMSEGDLSRDGSNYLGKLRSNFVGTEFQVFDNGRNPKESEADAPAPSAGSSFFSKIPGLSRGSNQSNDVDEKDFTSSEVRKELAGVVYAANVLGARGPRKMQVAIPAVDDNDRIFAWRGSGPGEDIVSHIKERNFRDLSYLINKPPRWNEQVGAYVLNFNGRVTMASVKNFQLVDPDEQNAVVLQFGRVGKDEFTMDMQWPMSPFQAFAITLSSFDSKIACD